MERDVIRIRIKEVYILFVVVVSVIILLWAYQKAPRLAALFPPKVSSDVKFFGAKNVDASAGKFIRGSYDSPPILVQEYGSQGIPENGSKDRVVVKAEKDGRAKSPSFEATENSDIIVDKNLEGKEQILGLIAPTGSPKSSSWTKEESKDLITFDTCNYTNGKWVIGENGPLYSGFGCKQWLSQMWACRLMQRKDFAYEKLHWQPRDCQMEFEGTKFLEIMQDKTLAFVGDSLGRQQFQSLMCMVTGGTVRFDVVDVGKKYGLVKPRGGVRPNGWAYRFRSTNTTILCYWSACLCDLEPIKVPNSGTYYAMHLDRPVAFLRQFIHKIDVLVLNTGHHWNRGKIKANRWVMHVGGVPNTNKNLVMIGDAKNFTIHSVIKWVNEQLPKHPGLKAFYRSISPRHFVNGDWNTGGSCNNTTPKSVGKEVLQDESSDRSAVSAVKGTSVKLLDVTALSQLRDEGHISRFSRAASSGVQDCLHWCLPGVPDTWNELLYAQIYQNTKNRIRAPNRI